MTNFESELDDVFNSHDMAEHSQQEVLGCKDCYKSIKQAVSTHIIKEDVDMPMKQFEHAYHDCQIANALRRDMRQALGDKHE